MSSERAWLAIAWTAAVVGVALRAFAARGDLWLDELWSLALLEPAQSALDVFLKIHHDNNHYLSSLWLWALGGGAAPLLYRLPAVLSGFGLVTLAIAAPFARAPAAVGVTAVLLAGSRFLVHYGSEARGYGLAMCFALACYVSLERWLAGERRVWAAAFAAAACLGVLSHLTFVFVLAAAFAWVGFEGVRRRRVDFAGLALVVTPALLVAGLWWVDVRHSQVGGAPVTPIWDTVRELTRTTFGLPEGLFELAALPFLALAGWELVSLARARDSRAVFLLALFVAPVVSYFVWRPDYALPRHFGVLVPFVLLLAGAGLVRLGPAVTALALAVFLAGNAVQLTALLRDGRGRYGDALRFMLERGTSHNAAIGGFNDFRNPLVLDDQIRRQGAQSRVIYTDLTSAPALTPEWILVIDGHEHPEGPPTFERAGRTYEFAAVFPYAGLSGWSWLVYRLR